MKQQTIRTDLSRKQLIFLLVAVLTGFVIAFFIGKHHLPGTALMQGAAAIGSLLLLAPLLFFIMKRSGQTRNPPTWFVAHVISSLIGSIHIVAHSAGGEWLSPPGLLLFALVFLVIQGLLARLYTAPLISHLFAGSASSFNFTQALTIDRQALQTIINEKVELLARLDKQADEALFSPNLYHWLHSPVLAWRYTLLAEREARLVGARQRAGLLLGWWRRLHLAIAALFFIGLLLHIGLVLFFAGYVAGDGEIYWWHITAWGG